MSRNYLGHKYGKGVWGMSRILMNRETTSGYATHFIPEYLFHVFNVNISIWQGLIGINTSLMKIGQLLRMFLIILELPLAVRVK